MILTVEGTYCPSSGELHDFEMRRHVLFIIWRVIDLHITSAYHGEYMPSAVKIIELHR
jgi:hypothetical protein